VATMSMWTAPVNQSAGPRAVSMLFLVSCMAFSFASGIGSGV
jgi:hypothetical protein